MTLGGLDRLVAGGGRDAPRSRRSAGWPTAARRCWARRRRRAAAPRRRAPPVGGRTSVIGVGRHEQAWSDMTVPLAPGGARRLAHDADCGRPTWVFAGRSPGRPVLRNCSASPAARAGSVGNCSGSDDQTAAQGAVAMVDTHDRDETPAARSPCGPGVVTSDAFDTSEPDAPAPHPSLPARRRRRIPQRHHPRGAVRVPRPPGAAPGPPLRRPRGRRLPRPARRGAPTLPPSPPQATAAARRSPRLPPDGAGEPWRC